MQMERDLLIETYKSFNARDIDAALANMHTGVDWPNGMEGGRVHGLEEVREYWTRQFGLIDSRVEPVHFSTDEDGRVVVDVHQVVRDLAGNVIKDEMVRHSYLIVDGLITNMEIINPDDL